jgi:hypothetical protein
MLGFPESLAEFEEKSRGQTTGISPKPPENQAARRTSFARIRGQPERSSPQCSGAEYASCPGWVGCIAFALRGLYKWGMKAVSSTLVAAALPMRFHGHPRTLHYSDVLDFVYPLL